MDANRELVGGSPFVVGHGTRLEPSVRLRDWAIIGDGSRLEQGVEIRRSVLWENACIGEGVQVVDSIVTGTVQIHRDLFGEIA